MNAIASALPELVGGSADLDPSTKTYLKRLRRFRTGQLRRPQHSLRRARARDGRGRQSASRLHGGLLPFAATFFNFVDYLKPSLRLGCVERMRMRSTSSPTTRSSSAKTVRRTNRSSSSRRCARRRTATSIRPADSLETLEAWKLAVAAKGTPVGARAHAAEAAVPRRSPRRRRAQARTSSPTPTVEARTSFSSRPVRKSRWPSTPRRFSTARASSARRFDAVLGALRRATASVSRRGAAAGGRARMSIEAGATLGWAKLRRRPRLRVRHRSLRHVGAGRRDRQSLRFHPGQRRANSRSTSSHSPPA